MDKQRKLLTLVAASGLAVVLVAGGYLYYRYLNSQVEDKGFEYFGNGGALDTQGWREYVNEDYGYSLRYPSGWYFNQKGFNPPPPEKIFITSVPEDKVGGEYSALSVISEPYPSFLPERHPEVLNLEAQGYTKYVTVAGGQEAIRIDNIENTEEGKYGGVLFVRRADRILRVSWESTSRELAGRHQEVFNRMIQSIELL